MQNNRLNAPVTVPIGLVQDALNIILGAQHPNYPYAQVSAVVQALTQAADAAFRESGSAPVGVPDETTEPKARPQAQPETKGSPPS
jgi:hypothetical protein